MLAQGSPSAVYTTAVKLAGTRLMREARTLLCHYAQVAPVADVADFYGRLAQTWGGAAARVAPIAAAREDVADFLFALDASTSVDEADRRLATFYGGLTGPQLAALCEALAPCDATEELDLTLTWCAQNADVTGLRSTLHDAGAHAVAYHLAERASERHAPVPAGWSARRRGSIDRVGAAPPRSG